MATETLLDEVLLKFFQAAALLKNDGWLAGWCFWFGFLFFFVFLFLLAFMSGSLYTASLLNLTSNLRFLVKKCGLESKISYLRQLIGLYVPQSVESL